MTARERRKRGEPAKGPTGVGFFTIVRGPLGSGKTTISHALAKLLGAKIIPIDEILELDEWDGGSEELFLRANVVAAIRAREHLDRGVPVVIDGNFYWRSAIEDLIERLPFPHWVFTLVLPLANCIERDRARALSYGEEATREVFMKATRFDYGFPVDATRSIPVVVQQLVSCIAEPPSK